nr:PREDICTED: centrosome-associated zinc finger protein CP190 [Tribolium castaneum]|eukprot:XP_015839647.1 PREDICTED: centrosome-associated zinc finger protein CP190 [Tribolium castaneum]
MRLYPKMGENTKQVRVDNWGIFFLQRLQMFFSKTDYCDMTLQFEGNVQLKVHRLVMNACTEYFQFLEQTCALEENVIMMPSDLQADVIVPIVNFMYTGMLEFHLSIFDRLYKTAQLMNITILTKLLDAQKHPVASAVKSLKKKAPDSPLFNAQGKSSVPVLLFV